MLQHKYLLFLFSEVFAYLFKFILADTGTGLLHELQKLGICRRQVFYYGLGLNDWGRGKGDQRLVIMEVL